MLRSRFYNPCTISSTVSSTQFDTINNQAIQIKPGHGKGNAEQNHYTSAKFL